MRILIVEDDKHIASNIAEYLEQSNYSVDVAHDGEQGLQMWLKKNAYAVIVLDINLPWIDGISLCERLRKNKIHTPIIMLTAKDTTDEKVTGLQAGADDYIVKPFSLRELGARIQAAIRRSNSWFDVNNVLQYDDLILDNDMKKVTRNGKIVKLTKKEYQMLELFLRRPNKVITKQEIQENVRWNNADLWSDVVRSHMQTLRSKVDNDKKKQLFHNVRGMWYILTNKPLEHGV